MKKEGLCAIVRDWGRMDQRSFTGSQEIFAGHDLRKYKQTKWIELYDEQEIEKLKKEGKDKGWDFIHVDLVP